MITFTLTIAQLFMLLVIIAGIWFMAKITVGIVREGIQEIKELKRVTKEALSDQP